MSQRAPVRDQVLEEAAEWLVECRAGSLDCEQRKNFDAWLRASPEHVSAYLTLMPLWESSGRLDATGQPDPDALIELARRVDTNVIPFGAAVKVYPAQVPPSRRQEHRHTPHVRRFLSGALAAAVVIGVMAGGWLYSQRNWYSTDIGEQRTITLADGSVVELNANSKFEVRFTEARRQVELLDGQALFRVSPDATRPFTVLSGDVNIRAVGTQFDVYRKPAATVVTVIEGRVALAQSARSASSQPIPAGSADDKRTTSDRQPLSQAELLLAAGQQVNVRGNEKPQPVETDVSRVTAWTQRRLIFSATPLREVAQEFNRYNTQQLVLESPDVAALRINGIFSFSDLATLIAFLREQPGIEIIESEREIRITHH